MTPHCRKHRALPLALYAGFALAGSAAARAGTQPHPFVLTAYGAGPGGRDLLAGRYPAALRRLRARGGAAPDPRAFSANSCVAFEMTQHLRAAQSACDAAVLAAESARLDAAPWSGSSRISANRALATVCADRAVLGWLRGERRGARADLAKAQALAPQAGFVRRNVAALKSHPLQAHGS